MKNLEANMKTLKLSRYIESFFIVRLTKQKKYSMNTIESYQATFRLFLDFICKKLKKRHFQLVVEDINVRLVNDFLDYLEIQRKSSARTRNLRISAIKSFFNFLNEQLPELSELFGQILAIPQKRTNRKLIGYLNNKEVKAILASPDQSTFIGRRDHILILILIHTGCRLSELIELRWRDVHLSDGAYIDFFGKGRKERRIPLSKQLKERLLLWSKEIDSSSTDIVFPTIRL
jgi:site-specific recombinase XerD